MYRSEAGDRRRDCRELGEKAREGCKGCFQTVVFLVDEKSPVTDLAERIARSSMFDNEVGFTEDKERVRECALQIIPDISRNILVIESNTIFSETNRYDESAL